MDLKNKLKKGFKKIKPLLAARALKRNTGGAMLKNPGKADLDKDGKLSGYEKKRGMAIEKSMSGKKFGGVMKRSKGGGADTGKMGERKSKIGVVSNKLKRLRKNLRGAASTKEVEFLRNLVPGEAPRGIGNKLAQAIKKSKANKMGGGMMNKPMGYKKGTMIMARGCKLGRKKATKIT